MQFIRAPLEPRADFRRVSKAVHLPPLGSVWSGCVDSFSGDAELSQGTLRLYKRLGLVQRTKHLEYLHQPISLHSQKFDTIARMVFSTHPIPEECSILARVRPDEAASILCSRIGRIRLVLTSAVVLASSSLTSADSLVDK